MFWASTALMAISFSRRNPATAFSTLCRDTNVRCVCTVSSTKCIKLLKIPSPSDAQYLPSSGSFLDSFCHQHLRNECFQIKNFRSIFKSVNSCFQFSTAVTPGINWTSDPISSQVSSYRSKVIYLYLLLLLHVQGRLQRPPCSRMYLDSWKSCSDTVIVSDHAIFLQERWSQHERELFSLSSRRL